MKKESNIELITSLGCWPFGASCLFLVICLFNTTRVIKKIGDGNLLLLGFIFAAILCIVVQLFLLKLCSITERCKKELSEKEAEIKRLDAAFNKKIESINSEKEKEIKRLDAAFNRKIEFIKNDFNHKIKVQEQINNGISKLLKTKKPFSQLACMVADYETSIFQKDEHYLRHKPRPANVAADKVREMREILAENVAECKQMLYKYEFLLSVFPELHDYIEDEEALISISDYTTISDFNDNRDRVLDWISENDYRTMPVDERNQLALDRYKNRTKSNWEIGIEYELYVGYLLREGKHPFNGKYHVLQYGELNGLADLGRDIIAERAELDGSRTILIIQCKRWSEQKVVHENAICQLYGTTVEYKIRHRNYINCKFTPVFITTTELSDMAKEFAKYLGVVVYIISMGEYPMIKCNINGGEKIYHLPFDQQYHRTEIKKEGEFYASTVKEATSRGFRRAMKHYIH